MCARPRRPGSRGAPRRANVRAISAPPYTLFFLSPANLRGERAALVFNPAATFPLAERLRSPEGAPLGEVYSFVSGLYFRGKQAYAEAFGRAPEGLGAGLVMSPVEGLRFLYEPVTLERLRSWADVDIDADDRRFTEPLLAHTVALERALGERARYVLLGSVATDKYVRPLCQVLGERLLFPGDFVGRGDMSRGSLLLRAARAGKELEYVPVANAERRGPRPLGAAVVAPRAAPAPAPSTLELVVLVGLPGSGKSTFFRERYAATHVHISKDNFRHNRRPARRQDELVRQTFEAGRSLVVDNTNVGLAERAELIALARARGARVMGYFFDAEARDCAARNAAREGRAKIPNVGIFAAAKRLVRPSYAEGFDALYVVRIVPGRGFEVALEPLPARDDPA